MLPRWLALLLTLTLLTQALAPAWASAAIAAPATSDQVADTHRSMPCHGASDDAAATTPVVPASVMDCCGDDGDCGHCAAGCLSTPGLPVAATMFAPAATPDRHPQRLLTKRLSGPPQEHLRPPIALTC
jgi:hypothetical protein